MERKLSLQDQDNNYQRNTMEQLLYFFMLGTPIIGSFLGLAISIFQQVKEEKITLE